MAITHFLLQSNFHSHLHPSPPTKYSSSAIPNNIIALKRNHSLYYGIKTSPKSNMKCFIINPNPNPKPQQDHNFKKVSTKTGINEVIWKPMEDVMKTLQVSLISGVVFALVLLYGHCQAPLALAASGGRMGGRSSRSSSRSSSSSRSYSSRSRSSRPSYSSSTGSYNTLVGSPEPINAAQAQQNAFEATIIGFLVFVLLIFFGVEWLTSGQDNGKTSVLMLQVGSLGTDRSLQMTLNRIAESADTSTSAGLNHVLQETILALLRHSEYCISGYSFVDVKKSVSECNKRFDQLSIEERGKFDEETLVNVNNIREKSVTSHSSNELPNEYIVVTLIVAARGVFELPPIKSSEQLKKALQRLASVSSSNVVGVEVLWTPQKEDDSLTEQEMLEDYPLLHPL